MIVGQLLNQEEGAIKNRKDTNGPIKKEKVILNEKRYARPFFEESEEPKQKSKYINI